LSGTGDENAPEKEVSKVTILDGFLAGILATVCMGAVSEILYRAGAFKDSQFLIDGTFVTDRLSVEHGEGTKYVLGIPIHVFTGVTFGVVYAVGTDLLDWTANSLLLISGYVLLLWLSMLFAALPVAGKGLLGRDIGSKAWLEQLVTHVVYGLAFWGALQVLL
jgi:hypothetical protein